MIKYITLSDKENAKQYEYRCNTLGPCRRCCDQFQKCPRAAQCDDAPKSCEYCTPESHAVCNFVFSLHSIEHSNREAYMQHIYVLLNHKPAGNFLLQITAKRYNCTIPNAGMELIYISPLITVFIYNMAEIL